MLIKSRQTREFIELKVDTIEETIFADSKKEIEDTINNLLEVCGELSTYTDKSIKQFIDELF